MESAISCLQKWVDGVRQGNLLVVRGLSLGRIIVVLFWIKYTVPSQIEPRILKLTIKRGQSNIEIRKLTWVCPRFFREASKNVFSTFHNGDSRPLVITFEVKSCSRETISRSSEQKAPYFALLRRQPTFQYASMVFIRQNLRLLKWHGRVTCLICRFINPQLFNY